MSFIDFMEDYRGEIMLSLVVILIAAVFFGIGYGTAGFNDDSLSEQEIIDKTTSYVRSYMIEADNAFVTDVADMGNLYVLAFDWDGSGQIVAEAYVTKDGKYFIPAMYDMDAESPEFS